MLGAWIIWEHCNACVFDGSAPCLHVALRAYKEELQLPIAAGAEGLRATGRVKTPLGCIGQVLPLSFSVRVFYE